MALQESEGRTGAYTDRENNVYWQWFLQEQHPFALSVKDF